MHTLYHIRPIFLFPPTLFDEEPEVKLFACVCKLDLLQFVALFDNP